MMGFFVLDKDESGKEICEKILSILNDKQRDEFKQFVFENGEWMNKGGITQLTEIKIDELYFCLEQRTVRIRNHSVNLTVKEFDLLALLIMHPKHVFTYEMIVDLIWHEDYTFYSRKAINNHVSNLRKKLKISPDIPDYVKSVYGVGYKFEV